MRDLTKISCLIVDDEPIAGERIAGLLEGYDFIQLLGICEDGIEAKEVLAEKPVDLMFVDIDMPGMNGLSLVNSLLPESRPFIIFATAYDEFAVQAFDLFAIDYLLKPFSKERFKQSMEKLLTHYQNKHFYQNQQLEGLLSILNQVNPPIPAKSKKLAIKLGNRTYFIRIDHIEYINSSGNYLEIYADAKLHVLRETLTHLLKILPPHFLRVHKSSIVNMEFIQELIALGYGDYSLKLINGKVLRISDTYKKAVMAALKP